MISRELLNSTRNLIIQHLVFGPAKLLTSNKVIPKSHPQHRSNGNNLKYSRSKTTSTSNNGNGNDKSIINRSVHFPQFEPPITMPEKGVKGKETNFAWEIFGLESQIVQFMLNPGASITAETGALLEMSSNIEMDTTARGGFMSSFKRLFTGQGLFLTKFQNTSNSEPGRITFSSPYISKILAIKMSDFGGELICRKNAFLCGDNDIEITPKLASKFKTGFLGGQGFILQKLTGDNGMVFIHAGGSVIYKTLAPNEKIRVTTGSIVAFESTVGYDVEWVKGVKNILFSGEGLALASITGPGRVILQSLPFERLVQAIASSGILYTSSSSSSSSSGSSGPSPQSSGGSGSSDK